LCRNQHISATSRDCEASKNLPATNTELTSDKSHLLTFPAVGGAAQEPAGSLGKRESAVETLLGHGDWLGAFIDNRKRWATIYKIISPDGKTMTQTGKRIDPQGRSQTEILVFHQE
jgi:hypothetical protein